MSKLKIGLGGQRVMMSFLENPKTNKHDQKQNKNSQQKPRRVFYPVWTNNVSLHVAKATTDTEFEWPEFNSDSKRIKYYSAQSKNMSITDAFEKLLGNDTSFADNDRVNQTPVNLIAGSIVPVSITSIEKDNVGVNCTNSKQSITVTNNLWKYKNINPEFIGSVVDAKVISSDKNKATVDVIAPIVDNWVGSILGTPKAQYNFNTPIVTTVHNLRLVSGGFVGKVVIPSVSKMLGEEYTIDAFIPGSQIVLNVVDDYEKWVGKSVETFLVSYSKHPFTNKMSLVCSAKEYLKFKGNREIIEMFKSWCDDDKAWKKITSTVFDGVVTGVICTSKKCGVFVEIPQLNVTGMVPTNPKDLVNYKPFTPVKICIDSIEENIQYDDASGQLVHSDPYVISDSGILEKCSIKLALKFAE